MTAAGSDAAPARIGLVGAGRFARFVVQALEVQALEGSARVRVRAVADRDPAAARALAERCGADAESSWRRLVEREDLDVVLVATPPSTHAEIAGAALEAGRHVLCEKPLATTLADAEAVAATAMRTERVLAVDHVLRHNPLLAAVRALRGDLLGPVRRLTFDNDASDEHLGPEHWFWDEAVSGGILVEHGVHFFDLGAQLVEGAPVAVQAVAAPPVAGHVDLVAATVLHEGGALASYTHSFGHPARCERQHLRLDTGTAEVRVAGWIPVDAVVDAWTDEAGVEAAAALRSGGDLHVAVDVARDALPRTARSRGVELDLPHHLTMTLSLGGAPAKDRVYAAAIRAAMTDLLDAAVSGRAPLAGAVEGVAAVRLATAAHEAAAQRTTVHLTDLPEEDAA